MTGFVLLIKSLLNLLMLRPGFLHILQNMWCFHGGVQKLPPQYQGVCEGISSQILCGLLPSWLLWHC